MDRIRFATLMRCLCGACVVPLWLGGCASAAPSPLNFGIRYVRDAGPSEAFQAAEDALIDSGYQVDRREPAVGVLMTFPVAGTSRDEAARARTRLGSPAPIRSIAEVRIERRDGEVAVYCRVAVQEQVTEAYRMHAHDLEASDSPGFTPIDRDAATTKAQNTVWRTIRRDKQAERRILTAIEERAKAARDTAEAG